MRKIRITRTYTAIELAEKRQEFIDFMIAKFPEHKKDINELTGASEHTPKGFEINITKWPDELKDKYVSIFHTKTNYHPLA